MHVIGDKGQQVYRRGDAVEERHRLMEAGAQLPAEDCNQHCAVTQANVDAARPVVVTAALILGVMEKVGQWPICGRLPVRT
jgi:hypothetical protein